jgi:heme exporter protein D
MKVIEKPWRYGTYLVYDEVEEQFVATEKGVRVLPAPFFYDKKLYFELWKRYEPGEKKTFPNGGYEVVDVSGGIRSFDLDQVIIHPAVLKHKKMLDKIARRAEKQAKQRKRTMKQIDKENKPKHGKRGRPALDPAVKAHRDQLKGEAQVRSGGKRGRPAGSGIPKTVGVKPTGGKRGRPALTPEAIAQKASAKATVQKRSGGKRGRPRRA